MMRTTAPKSPNRRRVLQAIQDNPGICLQEIADHLGLTRTALAHHLRALASGGAVVSVRQGRRLLLFPHTVSRSAERSVLGLLRLTTARAVLQALYDQPTGSYRRLAKALNITPHSVRWHVDRLQKQGLIHVFTSGLGRGHVIHFHPNLRASLDAVARTGVPPLTPESPAPLPSPLGPGPGNPLVLLPPS